MAKAKQRFLEGAPITNARRPLILHILPKDVQVADRQKPDSCAIACAVRREFETERVHIHLTRIYIFDAKKEHWVRYMTPPALHAEIVAFDRGGTFQTGEYFLARPQPSKVAAGQRQGGYDAGGRGKTRRPYHYTQNVRPTADTFMSSERPKIETRKVRL